MISPPPGVRVLVAKKPINFRKGADGLVALVKDTMRADPFSGVVYVFRAKRADRVKLLFWDGTVVVLVAKRLEWSTRYQRNRLVMSSRARGRMTAVTTTSAPCALPPAQSPRS